MPYVIRQHTQLIQRLLLPPDHPQHLVVLNLSHQPPVELLGPVALVADWDEERGLVRNQILAIAELETFVRRREAIAGRTPVPSAQCRGLSGLFVGLVSAVVALPQPVAFQSKDQISELPPDVEQLVDQSLDQLDPDTMTLAGLKLADTWLGYFPGPTEFPLTSR